MQLGYIEDERSGFFSGGSVSNTLAGISNLGGKVFFNGKVGRDNIGFDYEMMMMQQGVGCDLKKSNNKTGTVLALVTPDSDRTFAVNLGAASNFSKKDINTKALLNSKILHLEAYLLENPLLKKAAIKAMRIAKRNKIPISIDLSDPDLIKRNKKEFKKIVKKYVSILFLNEKEAEALTGTKNMYKAINKLSKYVKLAVIKLGPKGSMIKIRNRILVFEPYKTNNVVDTTGAGDMYAAGMLFGISKGFSLEKSGKIASYAASRIIEQLGARLNYSIKDDIMKIR